jgi:hypothetical protein
VGPSDDMEKVKVGSLDDMDIETIGPSGRACRRHGRHESGVRWWGTNAKTAPNRAC